MWSTLTIVQGSLPLCDGTVMGLSLPPSLLDEPPREGPFFFHSMASDKTNNIWVMALQPLSLALSLTHAGVFSEGCEVYRVMMKGLTERHPQALKPAHWHVLMETCTPEHMCASTCVYAASVNTDTVTASRTLTVVHTEAVQSHHWSPGNHMALQSCSETGDHG